MQNFLESAKSEIWNLKNLKILENLRFLLGEEEGVSMI